MMTLERLTDAEIWAHKGQLLRHALRVSVNREDAEDLVQEVMIKAYRKRDQFVPGTSLSAWLFSILRTTNVDRFRSTTVRPQVSRWEPRDVASTYDLENEVVGHALDSRLLEALNLLSEDHRIVLMLTYVEGLTGREVAERIGWGVGTVRTRLFRGRAALRQLLETRYTEAERNNR